VSSTYVYAIIPKDGGVEFPLTGMGEENATVYSVSHEGLAAVVSENPLSSYGGLSTDEAMRYLVAHQRVVEAVMRKSAVLPVKFGTVLPTESHVVRLLDQAGDLFRTTLCESSGRVQMEVVVLWNVQDVLQEIGREDAIDELKTRLSSQPHEATEEQRVALGRIVQTSLERRRNALRDRLCQTMEKVALDIVIHAVMDDSMVANVALLVDRSRGEEVDRALEVLDKELDGALHFRCVGPLPPYSFATVEVRTPSVRAVDEARRRLRLSETATLPEIKRAYHRLAGEAHPDHNPRRQAAETEMTEIAEANQLLTAYAKSQALRDGTPICDFSQKAVKETLLVDVRRQEMVA